VCGWEATDNSSGIDGDWAGGDVTDAEWLDRWPLTPPPCMINTPRLIIKTAVADKMPSWAVRRGVSMHNLRQGQGYKLLAVGV